MVQIINENDVVFDNTKLYTKDDIIKLLNKSPTKFNEYFNTLPKLYLDNTTYYLGSSINYTIKCINIGYKPDFDINELLIKPNTNLKELSMTLLPKESMNAGNHA